MIKNICVSVAFYADSEHTIDFALILGYDDKMVTTLKFLYSISNLAKSDPRSIQC